ncbi:MAG: filamentous hemagglutinin N-terminal domain-containing protein [Scytonema sp. PMC 1069.18]|nr:filamentous hemagglutinin N-terminal domain-containing protein [Scytonema sp. PMC 1069.18]MEC4884189.1 filamentous hemagglutinin N-terminal domain-containing protein [Scytonema sp. PMC 1070.18]
MARKRFIFLYCLQTFLNWKRSWVKIGFGTVAQLLAVLVISDTPCFGQITPDATLGTESSQVNSHVMIKGLEGERIDGGAVRGGALFHSFSEFNVNDGQRVYFSNPNGITNIFTRVTGADISRIFGTLGVDGSANLFLLNPQGIRFGPKAQLDIQGSFVASTANSLQFPDGSEFSATNPKAPSLLTMSVTPGVQWGAFASRGTITNQGGNLTVGKDLTLAAENLDLQGQLHATRDLTLFAQNQVKVRDSVTNEFIASAGRNLTVQGNGGIDVLALNHPTQTAFASGGNLSLMSDGNISVDTHFSSGGSFAISSVSGGLANLVSFYDPIISANGDVDVAANYTGTSLLVEATGNIRFQGDISITGADNHTLPIGQDTETLTKSSALILRSGQSTLAYGGVNSDNIPTDSNGSMLEGITLAKDVVLQPLNGIGGIVSLTAASGDVNTKLISTNGQKDTSFALSDEAISIGGAISIEATRGSINTGDLLSYSKEAGNGGNITLRAGGDIETTHISSSSVSYYNEAGDGGNITLRAGGDIKTDDIDSYSLSFGNEASNGGNITLRAGGDIKTTDISSYSFSYGKAGNGGNITLRAGGDIKTTDISSYSYSKEAGNSGTGGAIVLSAENGDIVGTRFEAYNYDPQTDDFVKEFRYPFLNSFSVSQQGTAEHGGDVTLKAKNNVSNLEIVTLSSSAAAGKVQLEGFGNLSLDNTKILTSARRTVKIGWETITLDVSLASQSGDVTITNHLGNLTFNNSLIESDTKGSNPAGSVTVISAGTVTFNNSQIIANTSAQGNGGDIKITARDSVTLTGNAKLAVESSNTGNGGTISINTRQLTTEDNAKISASAEKKGKGGSINIQAETLKLDRGQIISQSKESQAGDITLNLNDLLLMRHHSAISASAGTPKSIGNGGNININIKDGFVIALPTENSDIIANAFGGNGGRIDIRASRILGLQQQGPEELNKISTNRSSDISASSDVGTQGQVSIQTPNIDPSQGLVQLSTELIDPTGLIAAGCGSNSSRVAQGKSEFVLTGRGGLPANPDDALSAGAVSTDWVTRNTQGISNNSHVRPVINSNAVSTSGTSAPLIEAQGMVRKANGDIVLTAQPVVTNLHQSSLPAQFCHVTQN